MAFTVKGFKLIALMVLSILVLANVGVGFLQPAYASASIVQQGSEHFSFVSTWTLGFTSPGTSGDMVVVAVCIYSPLFTVSSVTDSLGSSYTQAVQTSDVPTLTTVALFYTTLSSSGSDTVTVHLSGTFDGDVYIFEASGVSPMSVSSGSGYSGFTTAKAIFTSPVSFASPTILVGITGTDNQIATTDGYMHGSGFTQAPYPSGDDFSGVQYATDPTSPTNFPATLTTFLDRWVEVGAAFSGPPSPPIPEYPLGLPILAIFMILGYAVITRKTITKQKQRSITAFPTLRNPVTKRFATSSPTKRQ